MIITTPVATQPAMIYFILLSFSVGNTRVVAVVIGGVEDVAVVVSAKSVCTLEMLALRALEMLARELWTMATTTAFGMTVNDDPAGDCM